LRFQSGLWVRLAGPTGANLSSVFVLDSSHGWAVGDSGGIVHYDGTVWTSVADFVSTNLNSVFQVTPQEAWAVGDSATILHWTGISWYPVYPSPGLTGNPDLNSVFLTSSGFGLIVGGAPSPGAQATIVQIGPQTVNPIPEYPLPQVMLAAVLMLSIAVMSRPRTKRRKNQTSA
jgi:hypothetical protein